MTAGSTTGQAEAGLVALRETAPQEADGRQAPAGQDPASDALVRRLTVLRDRLLHLDRRNRSILLKRIHRKWTFDLAVLGDGRVAAETVRLLLSGAPSVKVCSDRDAARKGVRHGDHLKALARQAALVEDETGLRDTHVGFPFLAGGVGGEHAFRAPLVLWPVTVEHRSGRGAGWHLVVHGGEGATVNRALVAALRKTTGLPLGEEFHEELEAALEAPGKGQEDPPASLLARLHAVLERHGVCVEDALAGSATRVLPLEPVDQAAEAQLAKRALRLVPHCAVGSFPQGSEAIWADYEQLIRVAREDPGRFTWLAGLLDAPEAAGEEPAPTPRAVDEVPARKIGAVVETDGSQDQVLVSSRAVPVSVVRGPPGTGKSQTIVNLVTDALHRGERVLVVCQKRAALDVVHHRLHSRGLAGNILLVHDPGKDRATVYRQLAGLADLEAEPPAAPEETPEALAERIDAAIARLNHLTAPLGRQHRGLSVHGIYGRADPTYVPRLVEAEASQLATYGWSEVRRAAEALDRHGGRIARYRHLHPWRARRPFTDEGVPGPDAMGPALRLAQAALKADLHMVEDPVRQHRLQRTLDTVEARRSAWWRFLDPAYLVAVPRAGAFLRDRRGGFALWRERVVAGVQAHATLDGLSSFLRPDAVAALRRMAAEDPARACGVLQSLEEGLGEYDAILQFDRDMEAMEAGLRSLMDHVVARLGPDGASGDALMQEFLVRWVGEVEAAYPQLRGDPCGAYRRLRKELEELLGRKRDVVAKQIRHRLTLQARTPVLPPGDHHPNKRAATEWNRLRHEFQKRRRVRSMRRLVQDPAYAHVWPRIAPCWLVSPEAASTLFPLDRGAFDLVVFDEASQLAVERAVPALYRGGRAVVAGDEKQLPPFDLFRQKADEDEEDEDAAALEAESLLVLAKRVFTPCTLDWHYRSRHQELIDFSNHAYYEGRLQVAAGRHADVRPVRWHAVNGRWEDRRNLVEADKVVAVVAGLLAAGRTVGVATFNQRQQETVLDALEKQAAEDEEFGRLWNTAMRAEDLDARPFVKNIENVQGDERDAIVFSVAYGPDAKGRVHARFGPLNMEGGENRLNVAVTRAREEVHVVASLGPDDLPVDQARHDGPRHLQEYLRYARAVSDGDMDAKAAVLERLNPGLAAEADQGDGGALVAGLRRELEARGYTVRTGLGYSGYRVDLAVAHPDAPGDFLVAVQTDGVAFHRASGARERDVARFRFLERMGWRVEVVWSRDWFRCRDDVVRRLVGVVEEACQQRTE